MPYKDKKILRYYLNIKNHGIISWKNVSIDLKIKKINWTLKKTI